MNGAEFIRLVRRLGRQRRVEVRFVAQRGKGSHGTLYYGSRKTIVKDRKKELGSGLLSEMLANLGLDLDELRKGQVMRGDHLILAWPAQFRSQPDGRVLVCFPDLPEAVTEGDNAADAGVQAADCLAEAIAGRLNDRAPIPAPSALAGGVAVGLDPVLAYKAALYGAMRTSGIAQSDLARHLGIDEKDVRRLLDPRHRGSRLARLIEALAACGVSVGVALTGARATERVFGHAARSGAARTSFMEPVG